MREKKVCWRQQLTEALQENGETWLDIVSNTMSEVEMDAMFYPGFGGADGCPFTVWTHGYVYFPASYDGAELVASVPRNPNGVATNHIGGG